MTLSKAWTTELLIYAGGAVIIECDRFVTGYFNIIIT